MILAVSLDEWRDLWVSFSRLSDKGLLLFNRVLWIEKKNVLKSSVVSLKFVMDSFSREIGGTSKIFYHSIKRF